MGGPSQSIMNTQKNIAGQQAGIGTAATNLVPGFQDLSKKATDLASPLISIAQGNLPPGAKAALDTSSTLLSNVIKHYSDIASGDNNALQRAVAPIEQDISKQKQANDTQIMANNPRGGVRDLALQENEQSATAQAGRARTEAYNSAFPELEKLAGTEFGISQSQLQDTLAAYGGAGTAYSLAGQELGAGVTALSAGSSALKGASDSYNSILQTQAQQKGAIMGLIGNLAGGAATVAGAGIKACWIAAAIYGPFTTEFFAARRYIFDRWQGRIADITRNLYLRFGPRVAVLVQRHRLVRAALKPLFDIAVERGR